MNDEKKYKEALKVIKDNMDALDEISETGAKVVNIQFIKNCFYKAFPELKESEGERMRKAIIDIIKSQKEQQCHIDSSIYNEMIDWLEKQCEKKHKFIVGDIISNNNVIYRVDNIVKNCIGQDCYFLVNVEREKNGTRYLKLIDSDGKTHNSGEITWLCEQVDAKFEKQGKQEEPQVYETEEGEVITYSENEGYKVIEHKFNVGDKIKTKNEESLIITRIDRWGYWSEDLFICDFDEECLWDLVEQKSAWSDEDERMLVDCFNILHRSDYSTDKVTKTFNWLKQIKYRIVG